MQREDRISGVDHPQVIAIPPLVYAGAFGLGLILEGMLRTDVPWRMLRIGLGTALLLGGLGFMGAALRAFRRAGTHVEVYLPATALVKTGPYGVTRNPIYLGMTMAYLGSACLINSVWVAMCAIPAVAVIHYGVVLREESYLGGKFGDDYHRYRTAVPRWLSVAGGRSAAW